MSGPFGSTTTAGWQRKDVRGREGRHNRVVAHPDSVVGMAESTGHSRIEGKKQSKLGRQRRKQWRSRKKGLGGIVAMGEVFKSISPVEAESKCGKPHISRVGRGERRNHEVLQAVPQKWWASSKGASTTRKSLSSL